MPHLPVDELSGRLRFGRHRSSRASLAEVAHPEHLPIADVPDVAVVVTQLGHPETDRLHKARSLVHVDKISDTELILHEHEDAGNQVFDVSVSPEAKR